MPAWGRHSVDETTWPYLGHKPRYMGHYTQQSAIATYRSKCDSPARCRAAKLDEAATMNLRSNAHSHQRFHDHFVIAKMLRGYHQGYDPGVS